MSINILENKFIELNKRQKRELNYYNPKSKHKHVWLKEYKNEFFNEEELINKKKIKDIIFNESLKNRIRENLMLNLPHKNISHKKTKSNDFLLKEYKTNFSKKNDFENINYYYKKSENKNWYNNSIKKKSKINLLPFKKNKKIDNQLNYENIKKKLSNTTYDKKINLLNNNSKLIFKKHNSNFKKIIINHNSFDSDTINNNKELKKDNITNYINIIKNNNKIINKKKILNILLENINIENLSLFDFNFLDKMNKNYKIEIVDLNQFIIYSFELKNSKLFINSKLIDINNFSSLLFKLNIKSIVYIIIKTTENKIIDTRFLNLKNPIIFNKNKIKNIIYNFLKKLLDYNIITKEKKIIYNFIIKDKFIIEYNHKLKSIINY